MFRDRSSSIGGMLFLVCANASLLTGCGAEGLEESVVDDSMVGEAEEPLLRPSNWGLWPGHVVNVCWDGATWDNPSLATFRTNARTFTEEHIGRVADIRFVGWGKCPTFIFNPLTFRWTGVGTLSLRTNVSRTNSQGGFGLFGSTGSGYQWNGPTLVEYGQDGLAGGNGSQGVILHEVMHALGFAHEFNRPENATTKDCAFQTSQPGSTYGTPYDHDSITNFTYCSGPSGALSPWDIVGLQNVFGRKPAGSIVGLNDKCVEVAPGSPSGAGVRTVTCNGGSNQLWRRNSASHLFLPGIANSTMTASGTALFTAAQNAPATQNQQWFFRNVEIRAIGNKCVAVQGGNFVNHALLEIQTCNGSAAQKWQVSPEGRISHGNVCWDVPSASNADQNPIQTYGCHGGANQVFALSQKGELTFGGKCVDVRGGAPNDGSTLQLWPCKTDTDVSRQNQRYFLRGPIEVGTGLCLDMPGFNVADGAATQVFTCNGGANQTWDYWLQPFVPPVG